MKKKEFRDWIAILPLGYFDSIGITQIIHEDGETYVEYMHSEDNKVHKRKLRYYKNGQTYFIDDGGRRWKLSDFIRKEVM